MSEEDVEQLIEDFEEAHLEIAAPTAPGLEVSEEDSVIAQCTECRRGRPRMANAGEARKVADDRMRRLLSIALALLIGSALAVPTAQAARVEPPVRYRFFQDVSIPRFEFPGRILFGVRYERNRHGEFTPRVAVGYRLQVGMNCNPGGSFLFSIGANGFSKYGYFSEVLTNGHFSHPFGSELPDPSLIKGDLIGTVLKRLKRGGRVVRTARVDGTFNVEDFDPFGLAGVQENCATSGSYSASTCKTPRMSPQSPHFDRWKRWKVPKCFGTLW